MLKGSNITKIYTLKTMYDNNCIEVQDDKGNSYRLPTETIIQMVNDFSFDTHKKKVHTYLTKAIPYI